MRVAIIGGTGTLGNALVDRYMAVENDVSIFSRCELKQSEMKKRFLGKRVHFTIGDIRDSSAVSRFMAYGDFDAVFHVAALKHVDALEENPQEAVATNITGTINVADACQAFEVPLCLFSSTDKAVYPINAYGMSKGIAEKILLARNRSGCTKFGVFRWGNVIGSRGSVIPLFVDKIKKGENIDITDPKMTRFWIRVSDAVQFMIDRMYSTSQFSAEVPKMKSATIMDVVYAIADNLGVPRKKLHFNIIGNRGGEKLHEFLVSQHEITPISSNASEKFDHDELRSLLYPFCRGLV